MRSIRIAAESAEAIKNCLATVNKSATEHTFTFAELVEVSDLAEKEVMKCVLKRNAPGARFVAKSGRKVASAYKYSRICNQAILERRSSSWFLIDLVTCKLGNFQVGARKLLLIAEQDELAVAAFRRRYDVQKTPVAAA